MPVSVGNTSYDHPFVSSFGTVTMIPGCLDIRTQLNAIKAWENPDNFVCNIKLLEEIATTFRENMGVKEDDKILIMEESLADIPVVITSRDEMMVGRNNVTFDSGKFVDGDVVIIYSDLVDDSNQIAKKVAELNARGIKVSKILATMIDAAIVNDNFGAKVYALAEV